ncbi:predicted protein [Sclerotinia sclerotiorum 1980 UF-70]|uniref:Uncharacterized protein n=2 Tax=Sclerotinia sclerotiorum (strain ATCC 18683 / 1980 / Ss-1) TaxID=665079 RepID=A7ER77_SCLS1|nr:predicted protein [Sclerotinia sclerotiorum 1980 UF-70]APA13532.1 hypothetical protein sscle_11g083020 [Sclerotinia sclerotiorum 1980 UF-70]EDN91969.1 predicted protein [Sclerotinia sclerotiorum 1980 UF-70]
MGNFLSKIGAATGRWIFFFFTSKFGEDTVSSDAQKGDFFQKVLIYSKQDLKVIKRGMVFIDPGNYGPNLITDEAMRYVHGQPTDSKWTIRTYDGDEKEVGGEKEVDGEVELSFSGLGPKTRFYTNTFRHVPHIIDGIDMVLNHDFYVAVFPDKIPPMLMMRSGAKKESQGITLFITHS